MQSAGKGGEGATDPRIATEFARRQAGQRKRTHLAIGLGLAAFVFLRIPFPPALWAVGALLAGLLWIVLLSAREWRCPRCERYLGQRIDVKKCWRCGERLA